MTERGNFGRSDGDDVVIEAPELKAIEVNEITWYVQANNLPLSSVIIHATADKAFDYQHARANWLPSPNQDFSGINRLNIGDAVFEQRLFLARQTLATPPCQKFA